MLGRLTEWLRKEKELLDSRSVDVGGIRTVCFALGPYRNLTTLTAAMLSLHPNCQVLNHAGARILGDRRLNFLSDYSPSKFERFTRYAVYISGSGKRGGYGGSITLSHAFDGQHRMKELFEESGGKLVKDRIECLFWKESLRTSNYIREHGVDLDRLLEENGKLKFLLPIRNPLDCALSNLKTGHVNLFQGLGRGSAPKDVVEAILDEFSRFEAWRARHPERFFAFFAHEFSRQTLVDLAGFLGLNAVDAWCDHAEAAFEVKSTYRHDPELVGFYRERVGAKFADRPEFAEKLLALVGA